MATKPKNLAMDFAVLMLTMCEKDFLPCFEHCIPDMSDISRDDEKNWTLNFTERSSVLQRKVVESHPMGEYFIQKGYTWKDIMTFVINLELARATEALQILNETPE